MNDYRICGIFDGDFNLTVFVIFTPSPNLMYANTNY